MALVHALASCIDCGKEWGSLNAQGVGARHHYSTGHQVITEVCYSKTFLRTEMPRAVRRATEPQETGG